MIGGRRLWLRDMRCGAQTGDKNEKTFVFALYGLYRRACVLPVADARTQTGFWGMGRADSDGRRASIQKGI